MPYQLWCSCAVGFSGAEMAVLTSRLKSHQGFEPRSIASHEDHPHWRFIRRTQVSLDLFKTHIVRHVNLNHRCRELGHSQLGKPLDSPTGEAIGPLVSRRAVNQSKVGRPEETICDLDHAQPRVSLCGGRLCEIRKPLMRRACRKEAEADEFEREQHHSDEENQGLQM